MPSMIRRLLVLVVLIVSVSSLAPAQRVQEVPETFLAGVAYRNLGPFRAGAWLTDVALPDEGRDHLYTFYIAARNGGVWKTINNGTTFEPIFDNQDVSSIGAVAVAPSNANVVWVGTGEAYQARSSNSGDGIYKSVDAGRSFTHMGLRDSHHIAKVLVHPANPDVVYVAAMGHLWTPNQERGVFKTSDGGRTWTQLLFINDRVGVIDMVMSRRQPDVLYAAAYEVDRKPWHLEEGGPGSAIYKTTDGGRTWKKLEGLPRTGRIGRIGLDIFQKNPDILYAIVENANPRPDTGRAIGGEVFRTDNGGTTWHKTHGDDVNVGGKAPYSFNIIRINPGNADHLVVTSDALANSEDGGRTWSDLTYGGQRRMFRRMFGDVRNVWWDPQDPKRIFLLSDGGLHISYDGGVTADHYVNLPLGEVYAVGIDMEHPYSIYAGLHDHESWKGPSNSWRGEIGLEDWETVGTGDGMYNQVDPHLFDIEPRMPRGEGAWGNYRLYGDRYVRTANEPDAIRIEYYVKEASGKAAIAIADASGVVMRKLDEPARAGINPVLWNMLGDAAAGAGRGFADRPRLPPGQYVVTLSVGNATASKPARILASEQ
jgi:hypothetical protein